MAPIWGEGPIYSTVQKTPICLVLYPWRQSDGFEPIDKLVIASNLAQCLGCANTHQRNLQFVAESSQA
ncbi:hypothetical protein XI03_02330 [Bradyrhizobium sp. CCBAU 65884]|nr:hypothetical protein [Bradyrhizobium sp. CCBAU 65884]